MVTLEALVLEWNVDRLFWPQENLWLVLVTAGRCEHILLQRGGQSTQLLVMSPLPGIGHKADGYKVQFKNIAIEDNDPK